LMLFSKSLRFLFFFTQKRSAAIHYATNPQALSHFLFHSLTVKVRIVFLCRKA